MRVGLTATRYQEALSVHEQEKILRIVLQSWRENRLCSHVNLRRQAEIGSDEAFDKHLDVLVNLRLIIKKRKPEIHKQKVYYYPSPSLVRYLSSEKPPRLRLDEREFNVRKNHSDDLKKTIELWLQYLPVVEERNKIEIYDPRGERPIWHFSELGSFSQWPGTTSVESHDLFQDLRKHIKPTVFSKWQSLKSKAEDLQARRSNLLAELQKEVEAAIGLPVSADWRENNVVGQALLVTLLRSIARSLVLREYPKRFEETWKDLKSRSEVREDADSIEYLLDKKAYMKVSKGSESKEQFKERMDMCMEQIPGKVKNYSKQVADIQILAEQIQTLAGKMKSVLTRYLRLTLLPGRCEHLIQSYSDQML